MLMKDSLVELFSPERNLFQAHTFLNLVPHRPNNDICLNKSPFTYLGWKEKIP